MQKILILGAGLSSGYLIDYLASQAPQMGWEITLADQNINLAQQKAQAYPHIITKTLDINHAEIAENLFKNTDVVVSLIPAFLQGVVAKYCIQYRKHFLSASYLPPEIKALDIKASAYNLLFLNELGLDPGLDHLSIAKMVADIHAKNETITSLKSYAGALVAPESEGNNPWRYKFTWNPRNVVLAGQGGTASYLLNGENKYIPYAHLFDNTQKIITSKNDILEAYPNRESIPYKDVYSLPHLTTILRGTLRQVGFCEAWHALVTLGLTDNTTIIQNSDQLTHKKWVESWQINPKILQGFSKEIKDKLEWLGIWDDTQKITIKNATSAQILQQLLEKKWALSADDKDMIVMYHEVEHHSQEKRYKTYCDLVVIGENGQKTAIAKTVGLPLAMATKLLLTDKLTLKGVQLPLSEQLYKPILKELEDWGVVFEEKIEEIRN